MTISKRMRKLSLEMISNFFFLASNDIHVGEVHKVFFFFFDEIKN
jgi:hypothetical protein